MNTKEQLRFGANTNEVNTNKSYLGSERDAARDESNFEDWAGVLGDALLTGGKLAVDINKENVASAVLADNALGRIAAVDRLREMEPLDYTEKLIQIEDEVQTTISGTNGKSTAYNKGYLSAMTPAYGTTSDNATKKNNIVMGEHIASGTQTFIDEYPDMAPDTLVKEMSKVVPSVPISVVRDGVYKGQITNVVNDYSVLTEESTLEDVYAVDNDWTSTKQKYGSANFRGSNSQGTKQLISNGDSLIKTARDNAITKIQQPHKDKKSQLNILASDLTSNVYVNKVTGEIEIAPDILYSAKDYMDNSIQGGYKRETSITDTNNYRVKGEKMILTKGQVNTYQSFTRPYKDVPDLTPDAKSTLDESYKIKVLAAIYSRDTDTAANLVSNVQQKVAVGPTIKSSIYSEDEKMQEAGLELFDSISRNNKLLPMVLETEEISEFTSLSVLTKAGYSVEQSVQSVENYNATPPADRRKPTKDVNERLISRAEGWTSLQYASGKKMVEVMSHSGVSESVIEDYIDALDDKYVTKVDKTAFIFGGFNVLNEGGSVPNVSEELLVEGYNQVLNKVVSQNPTLTTDDLTIVHRRNSANVVVVLKQDTSIVLSKGLTNMNDLTKQIQVDKVTKTNKASPSYRDSTSEMIEKGLRKGANTLIDLENAKVKKAKEIGTSIIDSLATTPAYKKKIKNLK